MAGPESVAEAANSRAAESTNERPLARASRPAGGAGPIRRQHRGGVLMLLETCPFVSNLVTSTLNNSRNRRGAATPTESG